MFFQKVKFNYKATKYQVPVGGVKFIIVWPIIQVNNSWLPVLTF